MLRIKKRYLIGIFASFLFLAGTLIVNAVSGSGFNAGGGRTPSEHVQDYNMNVPSVIDYPVSVYTNENIWSVTGSAGGVGRSGYGITGNRKIRLGWATAGTIYTIRVRVNGRCPHEYFNSKHSLWSDPNNPSSGLHKGDKYLDFYVGSTRYRIGTNSCKELVIFGTTASDGYIDLRMDVKRATPLYADGFPELLAEEAHDCNTNVTFSVDSVTFVGPDPVLSTNRPIYQPVSIGQFVSMDGIPSSFVIKECTNFDIANHAGDHTHDENNPAWTNVGGYCVGENIGNTINSAQGETVIVDSGTKMNYWSSGSYPVESRDQTLGLGEYVYKGAELHFDMWVQGCNCNNNFPFSISLYKVGSPTPKKVWSASPPEILTSTTKSFYDSNDELGYKFHNSLGRTGRNTVSYKFDEDGSYYLKFDFTSARNYTGDNHCVRCERWNEDGSEKDDKWSNKITPQAYVTSLSFRNPFYLEVRDYDTYNGDGKSRKELIATYQYICGWTGNTNDYGNLTLNNSKISIAESVQSAYQSIKKYAHGVPLGRSDDLGAYYNWYYCYDWAVNNPVTKQASGADEMVIRFKPSDSSKYSKFVVERYFKPVEYDIYIHENGYNVKDGDITYDVVANKSYLESSGFVGAYGYQTGGSDKFIDTGDPDSSYERRGHVWRQHYVYRYKKVGLLPQKAFTLKGWTADNSGYLVKPENTTIDLLLPIDTGTDAVKRYFVADYNTAEGRRTNRLDLYVLWHRNKYEITYDCKLNSNAVREGKSANDYVAGGSQYFAPGATYHKITDITKRIENSNGGSIDGTKKKVYMDLPYDVTPNGSNSSSTSYQTVDGKTVHGLGPFDKNTASGGAYSDTSKRLAYNEKTRPVTPNTAVTPKAYWRVEVYPHGDGAANRAYGQRTFSGSEGSYTGYQKDGRNNAVPLDSYKVNTSNIEARDAVNAYSKRYDLSTVASYGSRYQSTTYGGTSSAPAYDVGSSSDSPIKAGSYATSYSGNKSYVMFVQSTFEGWYRKRANNISPSLDRDKYSEHLRNKITSLSAEFGNDTLNQGSHTTPEVGYKSYIGVESDSSAYRKVRGNTKMTVASDHTLMGTWRNNSLILGVPKREYTVTFHGGFNQNDVNLNGKTGFSAYAGLTPVLTDPDAKVAWNNPSKDTSVYTYVHKWDFEGWGTRNCDSAGDIHWGSGDCRSGVLGSATSSRSHIESDANLNTVGNYQYINNGSSGNNGKDGTIAFTPTSHCKVYAHWKDPGLRLPEVYRAGYEFIGWYTKPQTHPGSPTIDSDGDALFSNAGLLYGGGDGWDYNWSANYKVTGDLHLYAWYNKLPTFVDIYEGLFFEGQHVSYDDLLQLIGVYDYEDNYKELQNATIKSYFDGLVNKVDADIYDHQEELSHLESEYHVWVYDYPEDDSDHGDGWKEKWEEKKKQYESDIDEVRGIIHELFIEKETIEQQREQAVQAIPNRAKLLKVLIGGIKYYGSGRSVDYHYTDEAHKTTCHVFTRTLTSDGYKNEKVRDLYQVRDLSDKYKRMYLETMTRNIGLFDITYQVHDEGIWYTDASAPGGKTMVPGSDVTLEYTRRCRINFNYNPVINSQSLILDSDNDSSVTSTLSELLMRGQAVIDSEDVEDNIPWWRSDYQPKSSGKPKPSSSLLLHPVDNDKTVPRLNSTLVITGVKDFTFASDFENVDSNKEAIKKFKEEFTSPELQQSSNHVAYDTNVGEYWVKDREDGHVYKTTIWDKSKLLNAIYEFSKSSEDYYGVPKNELWRNLTSMDVTFDAMDQWGKWASNFINAGQYRSSKPEDDPDPDKWDKYNDPDPNPGDSDDPSHPDDPVPWGIDPGKEPDGFDNPDNTGGYDPDKEPDDPDNPDDPDDNPDPNDKDPLPEPDPNPPSDDPYPPDVMQEEPERTVKIIIVTKDSDIEVKDALVQSRVRFISDNWYDTLLNSFWGTNGKDELKGVLESTPETKVNPDYSGSRDKLKVNVRDYSD